MPSPFTHAPCRDVAVGLEPGVELPRLAVALVKRAFPIGEGALEPAEPEPLFGDLWERPEGEPAMPVGSDYWMHKEAADVVVLGSAFGTGGRPFERSEVSVRVAGREKRAVVFGRREIEWTGPCEARIGLPEPLAEVPLTREHAYGGFDSRVPLPPLETPEDALRLAAEHPGIYPRNPFGKGYFVVPERYGGIELPNLEDPDDLLTDARLVVGKASLWHAQPLPACLDWLHPLMFPRYAYLTRDRWLPWPDPEAFAEVRRGHARAADLARPGDAAGGLFPEMPPAYYQEAPLGLSFSRLEPGAPFELRGMHPERASLAFSLPAPPSVSFTIEGATSIAEPRLTCVCIRPSERRVSLTYVATVPLPRPFIPGVHRDIPVSVAVDGAPLRYEPPVPVRDRLRAVGFVGA